LLVLTGKDGQLRRHALVEDREALLVVPKSSPTFRAKSSPNQTRAVRRARLIGFRNNKQELTKFTHCSM
jgi:hypothetical protein